MVTRGGNEKLAALQASTRQLHAKIAKEIVQNKKLDPNIKAQLQTWMDLVNQEKTVL
jgi:hypothetical protein